MTTVILFLLGWITTGILSYGLVKNNMKQFIQPLTYVGYDKEHEAIFIVSGCLGPFGIISGLLFAWSNKSKLGLCFKMPKELLNSVRQEKYEAYMKRLDDEIRSLEQNTEKLLSYLNRPIGRG